LNTKFEKSTKFFVLILSHHRLWGNILLPYIIQNEPNNKYFRLTECLFPFPATDTVESLSPDEREITKIINEYSERSLYKLFSKEKTVKEFLEKFTQEKIEKFIRPYIERRIFKCFQIARNENIPVYIRKSRTDTVHLDDKIILCDEYAEPVFRFIRDEEKFIYNLSLDYNGRIINLLNDTVDIICNSPCLIKDDHMLIMVSEVDGQKLRPFMQKEHILIPKKTELKYLNSFVLNAVNNFKVEASGFEIAESIPDKEGILEIGPGFNGSPELILKFRYHGINIFSNDSSNAITILERKEGRFVFKKFYRDFDWEKKCSDLLETFGFFSDDTIHYSTLSDDHKQKNELYSIIEYVNSNYTEIVNAGFIIESRLNIKYNLLPVNVEIISQIENDWFDLKAKVKIGDIEIPFIRFRKNILDGIREFQLPDGTIAILPDSWFSKYRNIFEFGKCTDESLKIHKQHFSIINNTLGNQGQKMLETLEKLLVPEQIPEIPKPAGLNCQLRKYQSDGINWLNFLQTSSLGGCLADDMGLGKTIQALTLLQHNKENITPKPLPGKPAELTLFAENESRLTSIIIVPKSLIYNWENEIKKYVPGMKVYSYKGNLRKKSASYFHNFDIILSSYHTVRQDIDIISSFHFHYIILDESQLIKNPASMLYKTMIRLKSQYKLVLTGTPVENSLTDLWTQLNFVNPGLLGDLAFFRREYAKPIEKTGDDEKELKLRKIIKPFILRRTKEMVATDLPPLSEQTVYCNMTDEQAKLYEEEKSSIRNCIMDSIETNGLAKSAIVVLQGLMKLRQLSNHPVIVYEDYQAGSGKFETVLQDVYSVISEGHKILVFSSFVKHLELFATELRKQRIRFAMLTGASSDREKIVNSFQDDPDNKVFLISLKAGGVGLNLTAAEYVFILDPWWNPASEMQAMNRAHRIGQKKSVFVYRYITSDSIEEKITRLQEKKSKLADTFISSNNPLKDLDIKHIIDIIE
jgi:superfamily II DNA or RNA helicase